MRVVDSIVIQKSSYPPFIRLIFYRAFYFYSSTWNSLTHNLWIVRCISPIKMCHFRWPLGQRFLFRSHLFDPKLFLSFCLLKHQASFHHSFLIECNQTICISKSIDWIKDVFEAVWKMIVSFRIDYPFNIQLFDLDMLINLDRDN